MQRAGGPQHEADEGVVVVLLALVREGGGRHGTSGCVELGQPVARARVQPGELRQGVEEVEDLRGEEEQQGFRVVAEDAGDC